MFLTVAHCMAERKKVSKANCFISETKMTAVIVVMSVKCSFHVRVEIRMKQKLVDPVLSFWAFLLIQRVFLP